MTTVSSIAMWFTKNSGSIKITWLGWEIATSLSIFLLIAFIFFFIVSIIYLLLRNIFSIPFKVKNNLKKYRIKKAMNALEEGLLASVYNEKNKILKSYTLSKKYLDETPLHLLLKLQNYLIKGNEGQCFITYKKMLGFSSSRPIAIRGLISIASKKNDPELYRNMLVSAKKSKVPFDNFVNDREMNLNIFIIVYICN